MEDHPPTCLNCNTALQGKFCYACGQKVIESKERTVLHFIYQFFGAAFFLENNFLKNLWVLLFRPGKLPLDFIEGKRKRWMPPFSLFLLINLFYFWFSPLSDMNLKLNEQFHQPQHGSLARNLVNKKLERNQISLEAYTEKYNAKSTNYSNSMVILHVPIFALFLSLLYWRKRYFYTDHFAFAIYFCAFVLLGALLQTALIHLSLTIGVDASVAWSFTEWLYGISILLYTFISLKNVYDQKYWQVTIALLPVLFFFLLTHFLYRTILFLIIYSVT